MALAESEDEFIPLKEAADYLGISRTTLWSMVREARITAYSKATDRRSKLFRKSDLDDLKRPQPLTDQG